MRCSNVICLGHEYAVHTIFIMTGKKPILNCLEIFIERAEYCMRVGHNKTQCERLDVLLDRKGCICHFTKWQIHPFVSKGTMP